MNEPNYTNGFDLWYSQIPNGKTKECRNELMKALGINNRESFRAYRSGKTEMKISQAKAVEKVFKKYGIETCFGLSNES